MNAKENPIKKVFRNRNFFNLWLGQSTSVLGDQFEMIAAPWLVLKLTNDPLALGTVMALTSIPRALFMLLGGVITDRFSARKIMLISDTIRLVLISAMAALIYTGSIQVWMLYAFALLFGTIAGFFSPAAGAMVPHIVEKDELQAGNALMQGTAQLSGFLGPVLAGGLIALFANGGAGTGTTSMNGIALAFAFDALSFLVSIITLLRMSPLKTAQSSGSDNVLDSIKSGIRFVVKDDTLRILFILVLAANLLLLGPALVGIPVLSELRFAEGAAAFGLIMSAMGGGNLIGILLGGSLPRPNGTQLKLILVALIGGFGLALISFAFIRSTWIGFAIMLVVGMGNGYFGISAITMLQQRTPADMLGRVMSLVMFSSFGLAPISQALSGLLIKLSLEGLFIGAGLLLLGLAAWTALNRSARILGQDMVEAASADL
jgi:MFS family permease